MTNLCYMVPIDKPEDITPDRLRFAAKSIKYGGDANTAKLVKWCADLIEKLEKENEQTRSTSEKS